jgi:diaminopimelate epimerase
MDYKVQFKKYHGTGNDFVLMDFCQSPPPVDLSSLSRYVCDRRYGIGADGLLLLFPSTIADFKMRIFNSDGSEPSMCGNGILCLTRYILNHKSVSSHIEIETRHAVLKCRKFENQIAANLGPVVALHWPIHLDISIWAYVLNTGVPHAVIFVDKLDDVDVVEWGSRVRFHPAFTPEGVNVNFATVTEEGKVCLRTYERGVEAETLACGTGAAAAAFVASKIKGLTSPVSVLTRTCFESSKIAYQHQIRFFFPDNKKSDIEMIGCAEEVFEGFIIL